MNPQDILNNVTGLLQNAQQASAQAQTHQHEISQALTGAVRELTEAVRALTGMIEALKSSLTATIEPSSVSSKQSNPFPHVIAGVRGRSLTGS